MRRKLFGGGTADAESKKSTSGEISIKTTTKNSGEKHAYVQGVG